MALTVKPDWESGDTSADGASLIYNVHGAANDFEAWAAVRDYSPTLYLGFLRQNFSVQRQGPNLYKGNVPYGPRGTGGSDVPVGSDPPSPAEAAAESGAPGGGAPGGDELPLDGTFTFSIQGKSTHITQSIKTRYMRLPGEGIGPDITGTAPDYRRAIGVKPGNPGSVAGCDIFEPEFTWTKSVARRSLTLSYVKNLESLVGTKNKATFYYREAGTTLFVGVSGRQIRGNDYSLDFAFSTRRNIVNKIIVRDPDSNPEIADDDPDQLDGQTPPHPLYAPQSLVVPQANGWDFIWVFYDNVLRTGEIIPQARAVYVEQVIPDGDFALLKI